MIGLGSVARQAGRQLRTTRLDVEIDRLPLGLDGYRILFLSDLHLGADPELADEVVRHIADIEAELGVLGGDYAATGMNQPGHWLDKTALARVVEATQPRDGWLGVLGNHDHPDMVNPIERMGVRLLLNEVVRIPSGDGWIKVAGVDDVHAYYTDGAMATLDPPSTDEIGLALVHSPELAPEAARAGYHLYLCGHTHGGQLCPVPKYPLFDALHRCHELAQGPWQIGAMTGFTTNGVGTSIFPVRWNCPAEVTLVTLQRTVKTACDDGISTRRGPLIR